jgi:hypothetical protein
MAPLAAIIEEVLCR